MRTFVTRLALAIELSSMAALAASALAPLSAAAITDSTPPAVSSPVPTSTYKNQPTTYSANYTDDIAGVAQCVLVVNSVDQGTMTLSNPGGLSGTATRSYTYTGIAGSITVKVRCTDQSASSNVGTSATVTVTIFTDNSPPAVSNLLPATATAGVATTISAFVMDDEFGSGINICEVIIDGVKLDLMTASGSTYSLSGVTFSSAGSHTVRVECFDRTGNTGSASRTVTVVTTGTVGTVSPTTAVSGVATTFSATYASFNAPYTAHGCWLVVDGETVYPEMALTGGVDSVSGTASKPHTFTTTGAHTMRVSCLETTGGSFKVGPDTTITVTAAPLADTTLPTVTGVGPTTATSGSTVSITASAADDIGISSCTLYVGGVSQGAMTVTAGVASRSHTFATAGSFAVEVRCADAATNLGMGSATVVVSAPPAVADATLPAVGQITQTAATAGTAITLTATASDDIGISSCTLFVGGVSQGTMAVSGGSASRSHTFSAAGNVAVEVRCTDAAGNTGIGTSRTIVVAAASTPTPTPTPTPVPISTGSDPDADGDDLADADEAVYDTSPTNRDSDGDGYPDGTEVRNGYNPLGAGRISPPTTSAAPGRLIKVACPAGADVSHPCKAVYYYGRDGKRHAFPSARVYFTWFNDFATVQVVDAAFLSSLSLGENVLPRPGVRLVKFQTVNTVYAVDRGGILRGIVSEAVAAGIYGSAWAGKIDDVVDVLFGNFLVGGDITSTAGYSPAAATAGTTSIDGNF